MTARASKLQIVKVGGSLFDLADLGQRLQDWLQREAQHAGGSAQQVLIAGGGQGVDWLREVDEIHKLPVETTHWLAIEMMGRAARFVNHLLPESVLRDAWPVKSQSNTRGIWVLDVRRLLREDEPYAAGSRLPLGWDVTSDSIAARVAEMIGADELVLLKSESPSARAADDRWQSLADCGYVDRHFPEAAARLPLVRFVNLRTGEETLGAHRSEWPDTSRSAT